jgi:phage terminase small subunit
MPVLKNKRHELFCHERAKGKTQVEALAAIGLRPDDSYAAKLDKRPEVRARIEEIAAKAAERVEVSVARIMEELAKVGFANMQDYMRASPDGDPYLDFSRLTRDQAAALAEVTVDDYVEGRGEDARSVKRVKFRLADKLSALEKLGKHLGMFKERVEHSGSIDLTGSKDALNSKLAGLAARLGAAGVPAKPD